MTVTVITVPGLLPSGNHILRLHWAMRCRLVNKWRTSLGIASLQTTYPKVCMPKRFHIKATRAANRFLDTANFATSLDKLVIDGLCMPRGRRVFGMGAIYDDGPEWLTVEYLQRKLKAGEKPHLELEIIPHD